MRTETGHKLQTTFPLLYGNFSGFECAEGWLKLIWDLSDKLEGILRTIPAEEREDIVVFQVKEKFGGLRFYMSAETTQMTKLIQAAEKASYSVCEVCGEPGEPRTKRGWTQTTCEEHK